MESVQPLCINLCSRTRSDVFRDLLHRCIDEICGQPIGPLYTFVNNMDWTKKEYEAAYRLMLMLVKNPDTLFLTEEKMPQEYHELPEQVKQNILICLIARREQLLDALLKKQSKKQLETIIDFDWRLKLVMGSSKTVSLREPLLQLDLMIEDTHQRMLQLELNKEELDVFINAMETIS